MARQVLIRCVQLNRQPSSSSCLLDCTAHMGHNPCRVQGEKVTPYPACQHQSQTLRWTIQPQQSGNKKKQCCFHISNTSDQRGGQIKGTRENNQGACFCSWRFQGGWGITIWRLERAARSPKQSLGFRRDILATIAQIRWIWKTHICWGHAQYHNILTR